MQLKICGMRDPQNIREVASLLPDYMGFIFYPKSKRYVSEAIDFEGVPVQIKKVGVFVNASEQEISSKVREFGLDLIQLHGDEPVDLAKRLSEQGLAVIKVFSMQDVLPLEEMKPFVPFVDFFLFDTKTPGYGGSGRQFDWKLLEEYNLEIPYFLSGGLDLEAASAIQQMNLPKLHALDVNSRFELEPGFKDIEKLKILNSTL